MNRHKDNGDNKKMYSTEHIIQIWDDKSGEKWEVGPDRDGLDLVEVRYEDSDSHKKEIIMPKEVAVRLAKSILELYPEEG